MIDNRLCGKSNRSHVDIIQVAWRARSYASSAQHYAVQKEIVEFAFEMTFDAITTDDGQPLPRRDIRPPVDAKLPAPVITLWPEGADIFFILDSDLSGHVRVVVVNDDGSDAYVVGSYAPGGGFDSLKDTHTFGSNLALVLCIAHLVALCNEPRLVLASSGGGTRQASRRVQRKCGISPSSWTRITWDISQDTLTNISQESSFRRVPLHWRRGHHRRALPHYAGAYQKLDTIRLELRPLWWQWIEGQWVGHPAFGVRRSRYAPRLGTLPKRKEASHG